jgi:hypothetical protein
VELKIDIVFVGLVLFKELEKEVDLYLIQEHWLFDCQLDLLNEIHNDYIGIGKAVDSNDPIPPIQMPRGYGGVAIFFIEVPSYSNMVGRFIHF